MATVTETVEQIVGSRKGMPSQLIEVLQDIQEAEGHVSEHAIGVVSEQLATPLIDVYRVVRFYKAFSLKPRGRHQIVTCMGTACHVRGAVRMLDEVLGQLHVKPGETTEDGAFTVESVNCVGACALGPVVVLDGQYYGHMTPGKLRKLIEKTCKADQEGLADD